MRKNAVIIAILILTGIACNNEDTASKKIKTTATKSKAELPLYTKLGETETGIGFINRVVEDDNFNYFFYEYFYNGGGVAAGDINNDGLTDLFFTGNMTYDKLYINKGDFKFQDISQASGLSPSLENWSTGVTMADVNGDGFLDIYVCRSGWFKDLEKRRNLLYINNGNLTFTEQGKQYGLDNAGHSTQATFFDYDKDGDLDMYLVNHPVDFNIILLQTLKLRKNPPAYASDQLFRNDGGKFTNVSKAAGIKNYGHGLGVVASDLDHDGYLDIYVANDYIEPDYYQHNNGDGTFTEINQKAMKHTSYFGMGVDAADINNDGLVDLFEAEMMAADNKRQKTTMASMNPEQFEVMLKEGLGCQIMHNSLQINRGDNPDERGALFSEVASLSNVANTDWSWACLLADYDNDGMKDIYITNGYSKDVMFKDLHVGELKRDIKEGKKKYTDIVTDIPALKLPNYAFKNNGDLTFSDASFKWGLNDQTNSNGAAYADFDNDGDLDLVVNNNNEKVFLYKNNLDTYTSKPNYLRIKLNGGAKNKFGIGTKVRINTGDEIQYLEMSPTRGYQSSVEPILHFGLGSVSSIDKLEVIWPDNTKQELSNVAVNQLLQLNQSDATSKHSYGRSKSTLFADVTSALKIKYKHQERLYDDYQDQVLLPHKLSDRGPCSATGDLNGDGYDDLVIGGSAGQPTVVYMQDGKGAFKIKSNSGLSGDKKYEDAGISLFDADGDNDLDIYIASGSYEFSSNDGMNTDRYYSNDGNGKFSKQVSAIPPNNSFSSVVAAGDYDGDGDKDLFVGGVCVPGKYPMPDRSYLWRNDGGKFTDVTEEVTGDLMNKGVVKAAVWSDIDGDDDEDLIVTGEWMALNVYSNEGGKLQDISEKAGTAAYTGWWNTITPADVDGDGDTDFIVGNLGLNSKNKASFNYPFKVYATDFDNNGKYDIVLAYYDQGVIYPVRGKQCSSEQLPQISEKFKTYEEFGSADLINVYGNEALDKANEFQSNYFESAVMINNGGKFSIKALPKEAQMAPINSIVYDDIDGDGCGDILSVGNQFSVEVESGRYDADKGLLLKGNCKGKFEFVSNTTTGLYADGDTRTIERVELAGGGKAYVITRNNDKAIAYRLK